MLRVSPMAAYNPATLAIFILIHYACVGQRSRADGRCVDGPPRILNQPSTSPVCSGDLWILSCFSQGPVNYIYRDNFLILNGSVLTKEISSNLTVSLSPVPNSCFIVSITFPSVSLTDAGNYTCHNNASTSETFQLVTETRRSSHDCTVDSLGGPVTQEGNNVTLVCSSSTGSPQWVGVEGTPNITIYKESKFVSRLVLCSVIPSLSTTFTCRVSSLSTSVCPDVAASCSKRIRIVSDPLDSYVTLSPIENVIRSGQTASYSCKETLTGGEVSLIPGPFIPIQQYNIYTVDDSRNEITFFNVTTNFSEPILECRLLYLDEIIVSVFASIIVLPAEEIPTTTAVSKSVLTTTGKETPLSTRSSNLIDQATKQSTSPSGVHHTTIETTTRNPVPGTKSHLNITILIAGLVIGCVIIICIALVMTLLLKLQVKKKDAWTVDSASSRRGRAEVASPSGFNERVEWERDTNPLVYETTLSYFRHIDAESVFEGSHDNPVDSLGNGHAFSTFDSNIVRVDAVIENHRYTPLERDSSRELDSDMGHERQTQSNEIHDHDISRTDALGYGDTVTAMNGFIHSGTNSENNDMCESQEGAHVVPDKKQQGYANKHPFVLHFVDATKMDGRVSGENIDSGVSVSQDNILSEIEDGEISIVMV